MGPNSAALAGSSLLVHGSPANQASPGGSLSLSLSLSLSSRAVDHTDLVSLRSDWALLQRTWPIFDVRLYTSATHETLRHVRDESSAEQRETSELSEAAGTPKKKIQKLEKLGIFLEQDSRTRLGQRQNRTHTSPNSHTRERSVS